MSDELLPGVSSFRVVAGSLVLLAVNLAIAAPLFRVEYSAYTGSIEGTFIALPRILAEHRGVWGWWPFWNGGMPVENAYLPLSHWIVAAFSLLTGLPAARAFHIASALWYALGPVSLFWMTLELTRRATSSFVVSLAYSCLSLSAILVPAIRADAGGALNLRRLNALVVYGEAPHTLALALLPAAIVCLHRALSRDSAGWKIAAGISSAAVALTNAFGIVALAAGAISLLLAYRSAPWWKAPLRAAAVGLASYLWISPWLSPGMLRAIGENSPTSGGDFRYTPAARIAAAVLLSGYVLLWLGLRRARTPRSVQFFALFSYFPAGFMLLWYAGSLAVVYQPFRYQMELDLLLPPFLVSAGACAGRRLSPVAKRAAMAALIVLLGVQAGRALTYGRALIRSVEPSRLSEFRIAKWLDRNRRGHRAFLAGSTSLLFNAFTGNPQFHGGHDQHSENSFIPVADYAIRTGANAGSRAGEYAVFWLKAFGVRSVAVSGPGSTEFYRAFVNPGKFDPLLPLAWREDGDSIYDVPCRSASLAHVIPAAAVPARRPHHGLDIAPAEPYVAALDDPRYPPATFEWQGLNEARIGAAAGPGQVVSVQISYAPGWEAHSGGRPLRIRPDGIGQMVIESDCVGSCEIRLRYTGGVERVLTRAMSVTAMLIAAAFVLLRRVRTTTAPQR